MRQNGNKYSELSFNKITLSNAFNRIGGKDKGSLDIGCIRPASIFDWLKTELVNALNRSIFHMQESS